MSIRVAESTRPGRLRLVILSVSALTLSLAACAGTVAGGEATATPTTTATATEAAPTAAETTTPPTTEAPTPQPTETEASSDAASGDANVIVVAADYIPDASTIEVRSLVTNLIAEGTCTVTATSPTGEAVSVTVDARPDAQSTVCPMAVVEDVTSEGWKVQVAFESEQGSGVSEAVVAEVRQ